MEINAVQNSKALVVTIAGRLDTVTAPAFEQRIGELAAGAKNLIADLEGLEYISSAGLRSVLVGGRAVKAAGGEFLLAKAHGPVEEVFRISGFDRLFPQYKSVEEALATLE